MEHKSAEIWQFEIPIILIFTVYQGLNLKPLVLFQIKKQKENKQTWLALVLKDPINCTCCDIKTLKTCLINGDCYNAIRSNS